MGAEAIRTVPTHHASDDDIRVMTREWLIDMFAEHMNMDANSRHILETFLQLAGESSLRAALIDDGTLVIGVARQSTKGR